LSAGVLGVEVVTQPDSDLNPLLHVVPVEVGNAGFLAGGKFQASP